MFSRWKWFSSYSTRKLEWGVSVQMAGFGAFFLLPPISLRGSLGLEAAQELMDEASWGVLFLSLGCASMWFLHVDGRAAWTPFARMASMLGCILALVVFSHGFLPWSPGAYWFLSSAFLLFGNGFLAASRDAGQEIRFWRHGGGGGG